jgi:hypothetical protein
MQEIHRPVLRLLSVIAERSGKLKFQSPLAWDQQIRRPLRPHRSTISGKSVEMARYGGNELWFTVRAHPTLKLLERCATLINAHQCGGDVSDDLFQFHAHWAR